MMVIEMRDDGNTLMSLALQKNIIQIKIDKNWYCFEDSKEESEEDSDEGTDLGFKSKYGSRYAMRNFDGSEEDEESMMHRAMRSNKRRAMRMRRNRMGRYA